MFDILLGQKLYVGRAEWLGVEAFDGLLA